MFIHSKFPSTEIAIHGIKNEGTTGRFEVKIGGRIIHSKAGGKVGKAENSEERNNIVLAIKNVLASRYVDFSITGNAS